MAKKTSTKTANNLIAGASASGDVLIRYPRVYDANRAKYTEWRLKHLFATGIAMDGIVSVEGVLKDSGGKVLSTGTTVVFTGAMRPGRPPRRTLPPRHQFGIYFPRTTLAKETDYKVVVTATYRNGSTDSFERAFRTGAVVYLIAVLSHSENDNISNVADGFVAWGSLAGGHSATSVTMNTIQADFIFEDDPPTFWTAMFPTLGSGTYTLTAVDSGNHSNAVTGLVVD